MSFEEEYALRRWHTEERRGGGEVYGGCFDLSTVDWATLIICSSLVRQEMFNGSSEIFLLVVKIFSRESYGHLSSFLYFLTTAVDWRGEK